MMLVLERVRAKQPRDGVSTGSSFSGWWRNKLFEMQLSKTLTPWHRSANGAASTGIHHDRKVVAVR
jgi:hypothetical protein